MSLKRLLETPSDAPLPALTRRAQATQTQTQTVSDEPRA